MKPKLIILSDLWGKSKSNWLNIYLDCLNEYFDIKYYDCCQLGNIDTSSDHQDVIHDQFINGGIDIASSRLLVLENEKIIILAFSIGGVIAWKAGLKGLVIDELYAISSTRLRYETIKPKGKIKLFFGSKEENKPKLDRFNDLHIATSIIENGNHEMYKQNDIANAICHEIINNHIEKNIDNNL